MPRTFDRKFQQPPNPRSLTFAVASILAGQSTAFAQQAASSPPSNALEEVIVTAQKRSENLQDVPISIQALDSRTLEQLSVTNFDSFAKYLPSLSYQSYGPGQAQLYVRGVTNGGDGLRVGSPPLVGLYLDEQPVTTIGSSLDVHIYDVERIEALSGPQGTLFGASSMAGTLRIITNKPKTGKFEAGYDLDVSQIDSGGAGGIAQGYVNIPLADRAAVRLVGYTEHDGGYVDNVKRNPPRVYPFSGIEVDNSAQARNNFNNLQTNGARAALKIDLDGTWSVTPSVIWQEQNAEGTFAESPALGKHEISHYAKEYNDDSWYQAALTIEGKIGNFDVIYSGGYLDRDIDASYDYSDYSYYYDVYYDNYSASYDTYNSWGNFFRNDAGELIDPSAYTINHDNFTKQTHEMRISSPRDRRVRFVAGLFYQRQTNGTYNSFRVQDLAADRSVTGQPGVNYLNSQDRTDVDRAVFTEIAFDFTDALTGTVGVRAFDYDNQVVGFFGYGPAHPDQVGEGVNSPAQCDPATIGNVGSKRPCNNIDKQTSGSDFTERVNLAYRVAEGKMLYATYSTGFRPGGVNRNPARPPYSPDTLDNYEIGWKTGWHEGRVRWNGALFLEKWQDAQFGVSGANNITEIVNAGRAEIKGIETDVQWAVGDHLTLTGSATYLDAKLETNSCQYYNPQFDCSIPGPPATPDGDPRDNFVLAPAGSRLPVSSQFKMNAIARYLFNVGSLDSYAQGAVVYQSDAIPVLPVDDAKLLGNQPSYTTVDLSTGVGRGNWTAEFYVDNVTDEMGEIIRYGPCAPARCTSPYIITVAPRTFGLRFGQKF